MSILINAACALRNFQPCEKAQSIKYYTLYWLYNILIVRLQARAVASSFASEVHTFDDLGLLTVCQCHDLLASV